MDPLSLNLWNQALVHIQRQLPAQAYETWFEPTRAVGSTETSLVVEVPNPFFRDWLKSHYTELIDRALEETAHARVTVEFAFPKQPTEPALDRLNRGQPVPLGTRTISCPQNAPDRPLVSDFTLNSRYTFDQFVIGPSNRFAHAAALAVSESLAKVYNPLFIYGGVGLGKTHLMQAIGHHVRAKFPTASCLYLSSERFTNQLIWAIQNRTMSAFRERFRSADMLLVDDIHFIGAKEATQEGFFHTFNALYDAHRQIVISSDRSPKELRGVEERLVSRFEWGLVTDIQPPDLETRAAILHKKAEAQGCRVPDPVTLFIAERVTSNIRELEGALNRVIAYSVLTGREISLSMAQDVLKGLVAETARNVTVDRVQRFVAGYFNLSLSELKGKRRTQNVSFPRQLAMALARELTDASFPAIGEAFGGRDHATVFYACRRIREARAKLGKQKELFETLLREFQNGV